MEVIKDRYTITELSEYLSVSDHTLRYYEKEFNITVPKDSRGRRYYTPDLSNIMYQIKSMRMDGLEIKAIKKILESEIMIGDPPPVALNEDSTALVETNTGLSSKDINQFFTEFSEHITSCVSTEINTAREQLAREINKSKLELGACVENNFRRMETRLDKHFEEVDRQISEWRKKNRLGIVKRLLSKILK